MSNCVDCGGNANPLDCNTQFMQCNNPCGASQANTPACETLPSQIQNFTDQFFGTVVKTEIDGKVVWSLPCSLDTGLPNNPRAQGEGLACYFLRLFRDGIGGLTGPKGSPGTPGTDGANTYTVTVQSFAQPSLNNPLIQIAILPNPSIIEGIGVFIKGSGQYSVTGTAPGGVVFLTMLSPQPGAPAIINAGALVVPIGPPSAYQGPVGPTGPKGADGTAVISEYGSFSPVMAGGGVTPGSVDYVVTGAWQNIDFGTTQPKFTPAGAYTYLVSVVLPVWGLAGAVPGNSASFQLVTGDGAVQYFPSIITVTVSALNEVRLAVINMIITTNGTPGQTVTVKAYSNAAGKLAVAPNGTQMTWVRLA